MKKCQTLKLPGEAIVYIYVEFEGFFVSESVYSCSATMNVKLLCPEYFQATYYCDEKLFFHHVALSRILLMHIIVVIIKYILFCLCLLPFGTLYNLASFYISGSDEFH